MAELDYDLDACLRYNPQEGFDADDIAAVLAVWEGENDGDSWRWIVRLTNGNRAYICGWCDYTGWDCQSGATSTIMPPGGPIVQEEENADVRAELLRQLNDGKDQTWRERKDAEMGVKSGPAT